MKVKDNYTVWIRFLDSESLLPIHNEEIELGTVLASSPRSAVKKLSKESTMALVKLFLSGEINRQVFKSGAATAEFYVGGNIYGNTSYREDRQ